MYSNQQIERQLKLEKIQRAIEKEFHVSVAKPPQCLNGNIVIRIMTKFNQKDENASNAAGFFKQMGAEVKLEPQTHANQGHYNAHYDDYVVKLPLAKLASQEPLKKLLDIITSPQERKKISDKYLDCQHQPTVTVHPNFTGEWAGWHA